MREEEIGRPSQKKKKKIIPLHGNFFHTQGLNSVCSDKGMGRCQGQGKLISTSINQCQISTHNHTFHRFNIDNYSYYFLIVLHLEFM